MDDRLMQDHCPSLQLSLCVCVCVCVCLCMCAVLVYVMAHSVKFQCCRLFRISGDENSRNSS